MTNANGDVVSYTINGTNYKCAIQTCATSGKDYQVMELETYVSLLMKEGTYINALGQQTAFEITMPNK